MPRRRPETETPTSGALTKEDGRYQQLQSDQRIAEEEEEAEEEPA